MRVGKGFWRVTLLSVCALVFATWMPAASADPNARAEELNAEGKKLVKQLDLEGAAARFRQAMKLSDDPRYAFNLCYTLEKTRNFKEARRACKQVESSGNKRLATKATQLLITIDKKIAEEAPPPVAPKPTPPPVGPKPVKPRPVAPPGPRTAPPPAVQPRGPAAQPIPPAYAKGAPAPAPYLQQNFSRPQQRTRSYRMQVFLADVASLGFVAVGAGSESAGLTSLGVGGLFFGGPLVHVFQSNSRGAYLSVGARLGLPLAGILLFSGSCEDEFDCFEAIAAGATLGFGSALLLDWFVFSKKTEWVNPPVQPTLSLTPDYSGAIAGVRFSL